MISADAWKKLFLQILALLGLLAAFFMPLCADALDSSYLCKFWPPHKVGDLSRHHEIKEEF